MRTRNVFLAAALAVLLLAPGAALAQQVREETSGSIDLGVVGSDVTGDDARFQRYRDLRNGPAGGPFRLNYNTEKWYLSVGGSSVARRNQQYFATLEQPGKAKLKFEFDQVPLFYSETTRTFFSETSPGVLRVPDDIQQGIQDGVLGFADVINRAGQIEVRVRRKTAAFGVEYFVAPDVEVNAEIRSTTRYGAQPWGASFGFSSVVEVPVSLDNRTTDLVVGAEWGNDTAMLRIEYEGSWFDNDLPSLVWDNPKRITDSTNPRAYVVGDGTSQGRMSLWPSSNRNTVTATGSVKLPARSRFIGMVSVGKLEQDDALLPFTINTAIETIPLPRDTALAEVNTLAATAAFTSRPARDVRINARYRYYEWDNDTPSFNGDEYVRFDQVLEEGGAHSHYHGFQRHNFDADVSYSPIRFTQFKVGYGYEQADRTNRIFESTDENTFRASVDMTGSRHVSFRLKYEYSRREGAGFDAEELIEVGEQLGMRHFDIADRKRRRFTGIATLTPVNSLAVYFTAAVGEDDYDRTEFGLQDNDHHVYGVGFDLTPNDDVAFGVNYTYENYDTAQSSRSASPGAQFDDPTRNWQVSDDDKAHTIAGNLDLLRLLPKTEFRFGYDYSRSTSFYDFTVGSSLADSFPPPEVKNTLHRATVDARYVLSKQLTVGAVYWYDKYSVEDYALGPDIGVIPAGGLLLGYFWEPYEVHTGFLRFLYTW